MRDLQVRDRDKRRVCRYRPLSVHHHHHDPLSTSEAPTLSSCSNSSFWVLLIFISSRQSIVYSILTLQALLIPSSVSPTIATEPWGSVDMRWMASEHHEAIASREALQGIYNTAADLRTIPACLVIPDHSLREYHSLYRISPIATSLVTEPPRTQLIMRLTFVIGI
jgi:hypothetical protein